MSDQEEAKDDNHIDNKSLKKLSKLVHKNNIGDPEEEDDEFEEIISGLDVVESEIDVIKDALNDMRTQIADLKKKYGKTDKIEEGKKNNSVKNNNLIEDDRLKRILELSLTDK